MDSYDIQWKRSAEKDLRDIDRQYIPRLIKAIEGLETDPYPSGHRKLLGSDASYRIRVGDYRIIYQVNSANRLVAIFHIRHRKDAYRK